MKKMRKLTAAVAVTLMAVLLLGACGGSAQKAEEPKEEAAEEAAEETAEEASSEGGVTINFLMANENFTESLQASIARWEEKTGNKVNIIMTTDPTTAVSTQIMAGELDLFRGEGTRYAETQWPTDYFYDLSDREWVGRLTESAKNSITWTDGTVRGIPISSAAAMGILYRKSIFEQAGITSEPANWDEFIAACDAIKNNTDAYPIHMSAEANSEWCAYHMTHTLFSNLYNSRGIEETKKLFKQIDAHEVLWSEIPEYKQSLEYMCQLRDAGYFNDDFISCSFDTEIERLGTGACAMVCCGDYIYEPLLASYPDIEDDLGFFPMPYGDTQGSMPLCTYPGIHVAYNAPHLDAALDFVDYFCSKENQDIFNQDCQGYNMFSDVEPTGNIFYQVMGEHGDIVFTEVDEAGVYAWPDDMVRKSTQEMLQGIITPDEFLQNMDNEAAVQMKALEKEGWT